MSSKPKQADYKPSEAEKVSAGVAKAEYDRFKELYDPLLKQMRDKSMTDDYKTTLRGRANADTQQALSGGGFQETQRVDAAGDRSAAIQGQLGQATAAAKGIENTMKTGVLGTARGQAAEAQVGLAKASRLGTSEALTKAKANQQVSAAKYRAGGQLIGAAAGGALNNYLDANPDAAKSGLGKFAQGTYDALTAQGGI